jgi:hypothetical protein
VAKGGPTPPGGEPWCLDGPFSSRILTPAANPPTIIKHVKIEETTLVSSLNVEYINE